MTGISVEDPAKLGVGARLRFLAKDSLLYGGAAAFNKAFALITFPILARHFTVQQYGVLDFFTVLASLLTVLFVFGQDTAVARFFYDHDDVAERRRVISESFCFQLAVLALAMPLAWLASHRIGVRLSTSPESVMLFRLVLLQIPALVLINFSQNILKWTFSRARYLTVSLGVTTFSVGAVLAALLLTDVSVATVISIYLCVQSVFAALGLWFVRGWLVRPPGWHYLKPMLLFAIPYGIVCTAGAVVPALQRSFIDQRLGASELGLFAAGAKIAMLIGLPIAAFQIAWGPFSLAIHRQSDASRTYNWVFKLFASLVLCAVLALTALAEPVVHLLAGDEYAGASIVVFGLALGLAVEATGWISGVGVGLSKRSYLSLYAYGAFVVVSAAAMLLLLHLIGLPGIAWGAMLGYLSKSVVESWLAQRAYPLEWQYGGVIAMVALTIGLGAAAQVVGARSGAAAGSITAALSIPTLLLFAWIRVLDSSERGRVIAVVRGARDSIG